MKRLFALFLAVCLLLCACGKNDETTPSTEASTQPSTEATTEATEATEPEVKYRHPLTGEPLDAPYTIRPTAVVINNLVYALPQYGIGQADVLYELITEGDITRCLAVFSDLSDVQSIGPVRSARTFFNNIAVSYDAPLAHCGGSSAALNAQYDDSGVSIPNWQHLDEIFNGSYFFRDLERYSSGVAWEHCLFTNGEKLTAGLASKGFEATSKEPVDFGLQFSENVKLDGEKAEVVTVNFKGGKTTTMTYNKEDGVYTASQYGKDHIDATTGNTQAYRNVFVLYTNQRGSFDGVYTRSYYDLLGEGEGVFACGGKIVPIKWERKNIEDPFSYKLKDGKPVTLGVGKTYVGIVSSNCPADYE